MSDCPEPRLDPPEDVVLCECHVCKQDIYEGEPHWVYEGKPLCYEHLDPDIANLIGCMLTDGNE